MLSQQQRISFDKTVMSANYRASGFATSFLSTLREGHEGNAASAALLLSLDAVMAVATGFVSGLLVSIYCPLVNLRRGLKCVTTVHLDSRMNGLYVAGVCHCTFILFSTQ